MGGPSQSDIKAYTDALTAGSAITNLSMGTQGGFVSYANGYTVSVNGAGEITGLSYSSPQPQQQVSGPAAPSPAPAPAHLQFNAQTIGASTFLAYGNVRLPGQVIWAQDIAASDTAVTTSTLSFAVAFCEPIDPTEVITVNRMWANGTEFYNLGQGGVIDVGNIDATTITQMQACVSSMRVYSGAEDQIPDPDIEADALSLTLDTPAYRGLRYIKFTDFPLLIAGNSVPNINVEFTVASSTFLVKDVMILLAAHKGRALTVEGIDSATCAGLVITSPVTLTQHLSDHKEIYGYQILDGDPIRIVRRVVESDLVIDLEVDEADLIRRGQNPVIVAQRVEPSSLPIGIDLHYTDVDFDYDVKTQVARHDGTAASSTISSLNTDYITDAVTARILAFDILYQLRSKSLQIAFELDDLRPEVGDVIAVTRTSGDLYITLVDKQTNTKTRSNVVQTYALLTSAGVDLDGMGGAVRNAGIYWPEECIWNDFIPSATRIWGNRRFYANFNTNPPARRVPLAKVSNKAHNDLLLGYSGLELCAMLEDNDHIYWINSNDLNVFRTRKDTANLTKQIQMLNFPNYTTTGGGTDFTNKATMEETCVIHDNILYIAHYGSTGPANFTERWHILAIDIGAWNTSAVTAYTYWSASDDANGASPDYHFFPYAMRVSDNGTLIVVGTTDIASGISGRYFYANVSDLTTWGHGDLGTTNFPRTAAQSGNWIYALSAPAALDTTATKNVIVFDCTASPPTHSTIDLHVQDPDFLYCSNRWDPPNLSVSPTHLFVAGNFTRSLLLSTDHPPQGERSYLGRFTHGTLVADGGKYLSDMLPTIDTDLYVTRGKYFDGKMYFSTWGVAYDTFFIIANEDLSSPIHYPPPTKPNPPENNDFAGATRIFAGDLLSGNNSYGTTEAGEPLPPWAWDGVSATTDDQTVYAWAVNNGHSVWYRFVCDATADYVIDVITTDYDIPPTQNYHGVIVYTGSDIGSLSVVDFTPSMYTYSSTPLQLPSTEVTFTGTAGTTYMIAVRHDATSSNSIGWRGSGTLGTPEPTMVKQGTFSIGLTVSGVVGAVGEDILTEDGETMITEDAADNIVTEG